MTHTQTVMLRLLTMCIPFRNLRKKWRTFLRDFLSDYDRDARRSMRAWRRHPVAGRTILILEPNYCHGEVIPGFCRHLLDMGYRVDVLMHHSLARQSPLCCFKEGDIHIFTAMCTSWKRLAKARVLTRYEAILISTSAFYDIPGWASFLHMTGLDKFANLLAVEHELKDIPRFGEEELDRQGRLLTLGSFPRGMMVNPHFFGEIPVIHEKFASFYGFNDRNALLYREETLGGAMLRAIRQTEEEYAEMQQALLQLGRDIDRESRSNLERALAACSPSEPQQARP